MKLISIITVCIIMFLAGGCSNKKKFLEADFEATVDKAHKTNNPELILSYLANTSEIPDISKANACIQIALIYITMQDHDEEAISYFKKAIKTTSNKISYRPALIRGAALYGLAKLYMKNKEYKPARQAYIDLLKNHQQYPDLKLNCMRIYQEMAFIDACMRDYKSERKIFMKILYIQENNSKYNSEDIATTHGLIAHSYNKSKDYANSVKWSKKAIQCLSKGNADKYVAGMIYYTYAVSLYNNMQKKDAVKQLKIACNFFSENKSPSALAKLKHSLLLLTKWQKDDGG